MENISLYLEKFKTLGLKEKQCKELVASVIKDVCGAKIDEKKVDYRDGEVTINVTGPAKTLIFMNKEKIVSQVKEKLSDPKEVWNVS